MKTTLTSLLCIAASLTASAQTTTKLSASKANDYGLVYSLPTTVLDITIEAVHTVNQPGEFYKYAKKYLNADTPISEPSESWDIKSVTVNARGRADNSEQYLMQFRAGQTPFIIVDENGMPLAINTEDVSLPDSPVLPEPVKAAPTPLETEAARHAISEEMLQSQSSAKRAELAAQKIYDLRQSRTDFITGQADQMPPDGKAMQIIVDEIAAQEAALTAMFLGTTQTETSVNTITFVPGEESSKTVLARVSAIDGIVDADDLSGDPITIAVNVTDRGKLPLNEKGEPKKFPEGGVAYCIPGSANVTISFRGKTVWDGSIDASQYGIVFGLDPKIFSDKKAPAYLIFNPVTGAVKELGIK
ncbi:MAG: DUF4831 family protein [Muribaculum sp.]|nr:DUF4831 family protein [Muribaculum sp.]